MRGFDHLLLQVNIVDGVEGNDRIVDFAGGAAECR